MDDNDDDDAAAAAAAAADDDNNNNSNTNNKLSQIHSELQLVTPVFLQCAALPITQTWLLKSLSVLILTILLPSLLLLAKPFSSCGCPTSDVTQKFTKCRSCKELDRSTGFLQSISSLSDLNNCLFRLQYYLPLCGYKSDNFFQKYKCMKMPTHTQCDNGRCQTGRRDRNGP